MLETVGANLLAGEPRRRFADAGDLEKLELPQAWTSLQSQQELGNFGASLDPGSLNSAFSLYLYVV